MARGFSIDCVDILQLHVRIIKKLLYGSCSLVWEGELPSVLEGLETRKPMSGYVTGVV